MRDQILGCILGGAIGEAFGSPYEARRPPIVISEAEEWRLSDDTQLTLATYDLLRLVAEVLPDTQMRDRLIALTEIDKQTPLLEIASRFGCSGYVAESVPLALCGASRIRSLDFRTILIELIACGGDTDTNASIAGQVAGALIGRARLPEDLIASTPDRRRQGAVAGAFAESLNYYE